MFWAIDNNRTLILLDEACSQRLQRELTAPTSGEHWAHYWNQSRCLHPLGTDSIPIPFQILNTGATARETEPCEASTDPLSAFSAE